LRAEASRFYGWGGTGDDGTQAFAVRRPGWAMPIHELLKKHHASVVFHGHDHFYAKQERDGIVYELVPQPGQGHGNPSESASEYGYKSGAVLGGTGYLRVSVKKDSAVVEYVDTSSQPVKDRYAIKPAG
jgi:hypothetical protein